MSFLNFLRMFHFLYQVADDVCSWKILVDTYIGLLILPHIAIDFRLIVKSNNEGNVSVIVSIDFICNRNIIRAARSHVLVYYSLTKASIIVF